MYKSNLAVGEVKYNVWNGTGYTSATKAYNTEVMSMTTFNHWPLNTRVDDGGVWDLNKSTHRFVKSVVEGTTGSNFNHGETFPSIPGYVNSYTLGITPSTAQLHATGTSAIAKVAPVNPAFDMGTAIGELMNDGLPMVVGASQFRDRAKNARAAGGEYLNVEFGWLPLVRDIQGFANAVRNSRKIIDQYRKDSDQKIRRRWEGPPEVLSRTYAEDTMFGVNSVGRGRASFTSTSFKHEWFSGAFKYHVPVATTTLGKVQEWASYADHLLGVKLTPETLWNLAPWSWAADWFANTGDIMTNISNLGRDGMVMQYGYVMYHKETKTSAAGYFDNNITKLYKVPAFVEYGSVRKIRLPATPYGFGVSTASLSAKQLAVIAALGLSRT